MKKKVIKQLMLFAQKKIRILEIVIGNGGDIKYYQRTYLYNISGKEYTLNTVEINSKACKTIRYNPNNPYDAETYEGINTETLVIFFIGIICISSPFILNITNTINNKKISEIKYKFLRMSKKNILKITTISFWIYMAVSLTFTLREFFLAPNWNQVVMQYSQSEIITECAIFIVTRCSFKKFASYFNIFRS